MPPQITKTKILEALLLSPILSRRNKFSINPVVTFPTAAHTKNMEEIVIMK